MTAKLHFESVGRGAAILLLHAFPFDGRMWAEQVRDLSPDHHMIVPDLPGFGQSPRPDGSPSIDDWAAQVLEDCKKRGIEKAVVAGCSLGGYVAFALMRRAPGFFAGLGLIDTRAAPDTQESRRARYEMVERARHEGTAFLLAADLPLARTTIVERPEVLASARVMVADATPVGVMTAQRAMASRKDSRPLLRTIAVPTLVMQGEDDPIVPRAEAEAMAAEIPGSEFVLVTGAGHLPPIEQPGLVTDALRHLAARASQKSM